MEEPKISFSSEPSGDFIEDHSRTDGPAARIMIYLIAGLLLLSTIFAVAIFQHTHPPGTPQDEATPAASPGR